MPSMLDYLKKALSVPVSESEDFRDIIHYEGKIGGKLFGPVPPKHRREFFCLDENTWVWHEEWVDDRGHQQRVTTRYDVRPEGIFKIQGDLPRRRLSDEELNNFHQAVKLYGQKVIAELDRLINRYPNS